MHPAFSVIFFTSASGAGYGLLAAIGMLAALGRLPADRVLALSSLGLALLLITSGLFSSMLHLGHPERAWRALSQWRSSWLSREAVVSLFTFIPTVLFGLAWTITGRTNGMTTVIGVVMAASAAASVVTTGMIYASLKPIAQWHSRYTLPSYLIFAAMTGLVLLTAVLQLRGLPDPDVEYAALTAIAVGWLWKLAAWRFNDRLAAPVTVNSATGLAGGEVRSIEWPHTEENYVLKEMGYRVARKHAARLRVFVQLCAFAFPLAGTAIVLLTDGGTAKTVAALAALVQMAGVLAERWLFFAEARHTVTLYYGV
jgi:DMSO reductase anchor subunit